MPPLLMKLVFERIEDRADAVLREADRARHRRQGAETASSTRTSKRQIDFMEASSRSAPWFAGDEFSAADIQMSFPIEAAAQRAGLDASRPKLMTFLKKIHARPAFRKALERGGPYSFAND